MKNVATEHVFALKKASQKMAQGLVDEVAAWGLDPLETISGCILGSALASASIIASYTKRHNVSDEVAINTFVQHLKMGLEMGRGNGL